MGIITITLSVLSCCVDFAYRIVLGGWQEGFTYLGRTEPISLIFNPLGYILFVCHLDRVVSIFLVVCGIFLLLRKNWARKILLVFFWINLFLLSVGYFLKALFESAMLMTLSLQTVALLQTTPGVLAGYLQKLNPLREGLPSFLVWWLLPFVSNIIFIYP